MFAADVVSDLEVEVNGEHRFSLNKELLLQHCGYLAQLFKQKQVGNHDNTGIFRLKICDFPGGSEAFEQAVRFCYKYGDFAITAANVSNLRCAAEVLDMSEARRKGNLIQQAEKFLAKMSSWDWDELIIGYKGCEQSILVAQQIQLTKRYIDALVCKVCEFECSPLSHPPLMNTWWFPEMCILSTKLMKTVVEALIFNRYSNKTLAKFLVHYLHCSLPNLSYVRCKSPDHENYCNGKLVLSSSQKMLQNVFETVVSMLSDLDRASASCKSLFCLLRIGADLKASQLCKNQVEKMIGSQLHMATLDSVLMPAKEPRSGPVYDVDIFLRLVENFLSENRRYSATVGTNIVSEFQSSADEALYRVGDLMDKYLAEVAPDPCLEPEKFLALTLALPDCARPLHDDLYMAIDIYLEAHPGVNEAEAANLCKALSYRKLSLDASRHLAKNNRIPAKFTLYVLLQQQAELKAALDFSCLTRENSFYNIRSFTHPLVTHSEPLFQYSCEPLPAESKPSIFLSSLFSFKGSHYSNRHLKA